MHDDGNGSRARIAPDRPEYFDPVQADQFHVEDDEAGLLAGVASGLAAAPEQVVQRLDPILRSDDPFGIAAFSQRHHRQLQVIRVVVHNEYCHIFHLFGP